MKKCITILILFMAGICTSQPDSTNAILKFKCVSDASAGVAIDADLVEAV